MPPLARLVTSGIVLRARRQLLQWSSALSNLTSPNF
jgi:hypothetical protein